MKNVRQLMTACAMLAMLAGVAVYGSNLIGAMPSTHSGTGKVVAHGPFPPPDDGAGGLEA